MTLTRWQRPNWDPARELSSLRDEIDRLFQSPLSWFVLLQEIQVTVKIENRGRIARAAVN